MTESNCYGDGTVYRGVRSKDSEIKTIERKPLDGDQVIAAWEKQNHWVQKQPLMCFVHGIRFAEKHHGITPAEQDPEQDSEQDPEPVKEVMHTLLGTNR